MKRIPRALSRSIIALALAGAFVLSGNSFGADTPPTNLTPAQRKAAAAQGSAFGKQTSDAAEQSVLQVEEGTGTKQAGRTLINGKWVDNEELMGRGYDQSRVDRAGEVEARGNMDDLKALYDEEGKRTTTDDSAAGAAYKTVEESAEAKVRGRRAIADTNWAQTVGAQAGARNGEILGQRFDDCTTTTTVIPGTSEDAHIVEQNVCEIVNTPGEAGGEICRRERVVSSITPQETKTLEQYLSVNGGQNGLYCTRATTLESYEEELVQTKNGVLDMTMETGGLICTRNRWATMVSSTVDKEKTATLGVNTEVGGLSCSRLITPSNSTSSQPQTKNATLPVDNQAGGNLCKRLVWPVTSSTPSSGTKTALLTVNTEAGGLSCSRTIWPTSSTTPTAATQDATLVVDMQSGGNACKREVWPTDTTSTIAGGKAVTIGINTEVGGASCTRTVWPTSSSTTTAVSQDAALAVDLQSGSNLCTREVWPSNTTSTVAGTKSGTLGINTEVGGVSCTRQIWPTSSSTTTAVSHDAVLTVDTQSGGNLCKRRVWPTNSTTNVAGGKNVNIGVSTEVGGVSCTRTVWPTSSTVTTAVSQDATLSIDTQAPSNLCVREIWPTNTTSTTAGAKSATLGVSTEMGGVSCSRIIQPSTTNSTTAGALNVVASVNNEMGGTSCRRYRNVQMNTAAPVTSAIYTYPKASRFSPGPFTTVTSLAALVPAGTSSLSNFAMVIDSTNPYFTDAFYVSDAPTEANGWNVTVVTSGRCESEPDPETGRPIWSCQGENNTAHFTFTPILTAKTWSLVESGNCADAGTPNCPAVWSCSTQAPTTINGIAVSAAEVGGLAQLFPGAPGACTDSTLARSCGGTSTVSNSYSIAGSLAPNTTSIANFQATIQNPQPGVSAVVTQVPSAANSWIATVRIDRTDYSYTPGQVQLRLSWNQTATVETASIVDSGNCADPGTASCPALWSCTRTAPYPGVSTTMAASFAPLYPGAASTCGQAQLARTCSGSVVTSTSISIADQIPGGVSTITNFAYTVTNPQAGVSVVLTQTPSQANGWIAIYSVTRSNWGASPAGPTVSMTWGNTVPGVSTSIRDTGNCAGTGTANCPATWACTRTAPVVINGITVTTSMAASHAPLYPAAASTCATGSLNRVCAGTASTTTNVSLAARMPSGTTSISGLAFSVLNPQAGVAVSLVQTPTSGNSWVAIFRIDRTVWGSQPVAPSIRITWNASSPSTTTSVVDSGNCADPGSLNCPTSWACTGPAPRVVNGITVDAAMAATQSPLFPGAASSCVVGTLSRTCGGSSNTTTSVSIADQIPSGTTSISGFTFTVTNPQAGVSVALAQTPSSANSWMAVFAVTRTSWASAPAQPNLNLSWNASVPTVSVSTQDTGNCAGTGSTNCPAAWRCETPAPTVINGINVTVSMAGQVAPLFPGAAASCAIGSLDKTCAGTASTNSTVDLASRMPSGTTSISGLAFTVLNPQTGVTVTLTQAPTSGNSWVAIFRVDRTNWATTPASPNIRITWNASTPTTNMTVVDTGDCADPGSASCPTAWACTGPAPQTVNGITVTASMAATQAPLFTGASSSCVTGTKSRTCSGSAATTTTLSIADQIPSGTTSIANFAFTVNNPQTGVTVALTQAPTSGNSWVATFSVTRTNWATTPAAPAITTTWDATVPSVSVSVRDTGNCAGTGSANCPATWSCATTAPTTINGINVTTSMAGQVSPLFPGAAATCARGSLNSVCAGTASVTTSVSLAARMPSGTTSISGLAFSVLNPQTGVTVTMTQTPTSGNSWVAIFRVDRTNWGLTPATPNIRITWNASSPTTNLTVVDSGNCADAGSASCPTSWSCTGPAPQVVNGITVTAAMAATQAPLYPAAVNSCVIGTLSRVCGGSSATSTTVSIASDLPAGTSAISGFAFTVTNPQAGVTVALTQIPTQANSWVAIFNVTRSSWASAPTQPNLNLTWNATVPSVAVSTRDTGDCAATGTTNCPTQWSCETSAPTTINGINVTTSMAGQVAPLFPGAAATCARGSFDRVCSGTSTRNTDVNISARIPSGTQTISDLTFTVLNPQAGVTVTMTQTPTLANSWIARFRVDRTVWSSQPAAPNVRLSWNSNVPSTTLSVVDTGNCADPGSTTCPTQWSCANLAPHTVNGISVTASMAASQAPLFPSASNSCVVGKLDRVCSGSSTVGNTVSIADQIPAGVSAITNFGFAVQNPQAGVTISLVTAPTQANGWTATFNVTRNNVQAPPAQPQITMSWDMNVSGVSVSVQDTGDCSATGTAQCPAAWSCKRSAPTTTNGMSVTTAMTGEVAPLFSGAANTCAEAWLDKTCSGSANTQTSISIASQLPSGTTAITSFGFVVNNPQTGVAVALTQTPSPSNSWVAVFAVTRTDFSVAKVDPAITMSWNATVPTVTLTVVDTGNCADPGSSSCPTQWQCVTDAPTSVNGITIDTSMAATKAPLFPGAGSACVKGELSRVCSGASVVGTTVSVAELIPAGVNAIQNFAFTVLNPQTGVTVSLISAPTEANGWVASFEVSRTNWTQVPVGPQIKVTFQVVVSEPQLTVQDTGDCADTGSPACPAVWSCKTSAPTTINGISVTVAMVESLPSLFPSASSVCVSGELNRVCSGTSSTQSSISIADQLPPDTTAIQNFTWTWTNQDAALTVTLINAPTAGNSWQATFQVVRNYSSGTTPPAPQIALRWGVVQTRYRTVVTETGDCSGNSEPTNPAGATNPSASISSEPNNPTQPKASLSEGVRALAASFGELLVPTARAQAAEGGATAQLVQEPTDPGDPGGPGGPGGPGNPVPPGDSCSNQWVCTATLPHSVNGVPMTQAMLDERGPLYPGDGPPAACVTAEYRRVCSGGGGVSNSISIAHLLQPGTQQITNYTWTLTEPGAAVTVASVQTPALANDWVAIFEVTRTNWSITPVAPKVKLQWDQGGATEHEFEIVDTGDCSQGQDDEFCEVEWTCDEEAPPGAPSPGQNLGHTTITEEGAPAVWGEPMDKEIVFPSSAFPAGTTSIANFTYSGSGAYCTVRVIGQPSPANASVTAITTSTRSGTSCTPNITFQWDNFGPAPVAASTPTNTFLRSVDGMNNGLFPAALAAICVGCEPGDGGDPIDTGDIEDEPPLFPGDGPPATCMKATKRLNCEGSYTGTECTINSEGVEVCVEQPPVDQPPNTCQEYADDPQCTMVRQECAEGGMSSSGWCYIQSYLYECRRTVPGGATDPIIREETTCAEGDGTTTLPAVCQDGSCSEVVEEESTSMSKAGAKMMILQTIMNDHTGGSGSGSPGGGGGGGDPCTSNCGPIDQAAAEKSWSLGDAVFGAAGIATANAQSTPPPPTMPDPFALPPFPVGEEEDESGEFGGFDQNSFSMPTIRFFSGKKLDCMKALGGLLNCCKKTPPQDQAPALWDFIKKNLAQANNARGRETAEDDGNGFLALMQGAGHLDLQKMLVSMRDGLYGGGDGGSTDTDATMANAYKKFFDHEMKVVKPKLAWYCDNSEFELAVGKQTGTCTHLGSYCQTRVLGMCIIKKDRYCCFNSPVTRIIREHMDTTGISDLGTAKNPRCAGVTIEQMSRLNPDSIATGEVEGRMAQGRFNIDIAALMNMDFAQLQAMMDGANSVLNDPTRVNPSDRNQSLANQSDPNAAYGSVLSSQAGYKPTDPAETEASAGTVGLSWIERDVARGTAFRIGVRRTGSKGAMRVRVQTIAGTAQVGRDYEEVNSVLVWSDGQTGEQPVLLKAHRLPEGVTVPRVNYKVRITVEAGDATLSGNSEATINIKEE